MVVYYCGGAAGIRGAQTQEKLVHPGGKAYARNNGGADEGEHWVLVRIGMAQIWAKPVMRDRW